MATENEGVRRNSKIFGILTIMLHIIACFMYGFYFKLPTESTSATFEPLFLLFCHAVLVVVGTLNPNLGFGLLFSYMKKLVFTGLGFSLLITALSIEIYFMMNCFWNKATIMYTAESTTEFKDIDKTYNLYLTNLSAGTDFMATLTGGFRCALAMMVAFSSVIGRAGYLEAFIMVFFGTIGYELNRQIIENYSNDSGGTSHIFVFGGFMGLMMGLLKRTREKNSSDTKTHDNYTANKFTASMALLGTLFTWVFFPSISADYIDADFASHTVYTGPYTVWYSLAASTIISFAISPIFNDGLLIRDIVYGPIAGGVAASTASYYVVNPVYGIVIGVVAGLVQVIIMNKVEKKVANEKSIFHSFSFTLFGVQGMLGACFAAAWNAGVRSRTQGFDFEFTDNQVFAWIMSLISAPMGIAFGAIAGAICMCLSTH